MYMVKLTKNMKNHDEGSVFELGYVKKIKEDNFEGKTLSQIGNSPR